MDAKNSVKGLVRKAYACMKDSDAEGARRTLEAALEADFDEGEAVFALNCLLWWQERFRALSEQGRHDSDTDKGAWLLSQWKPFYGFLDRLEGIKAEECDGCLYAIKALVSRTALSYFSGILDESDNSHDPGLLLLVGRCLKGVGNYDEALRYLEQASRFKREDGQTLSELADVNALLEETRAAKALFREAFFADPQGVALRNMESALIKHLAERVAHLGYSGAELLEWIPVWGAVWEVFSVKRELKIAELGRLKQSVFAMENDLRMGGDRALLAPRLLNRYLWLIDYYENARGDPSPIEELMLKIKFVSPAVYEQLRN